MSLPIERCTTLASYGSYYYHAGLRIKLNTTPQEFDLARAGRQDYQLHHGNDCFNTVFHMLAKIGNIRLLDYLLDQIGGRQCIDIGNYLGDTPIYVACTYNQDDVVKKLVEKGANVNLTGRWNNLREDLNCIPESTPLWHTLQITHNFVLAKFLLSKGGLAFPSLDVEGAQMLKKLENELRVPFNDAMYLVTKPLSIPVVIVDIIVLYVPVSEIPQLQEI